MRYLVLLVVVFTALFMANKYIGEKYVEKPDTSWIPMKPNAVQRGFQEGAIDPSVLHKPEAYPNEQRASLQEY